MARHAAAQPARAGALPSSPASTFTPPRGKFKGIRWDASSAQVYARINGKFESERFPLDTPLPKLKDARDRLYSKYKHGMVDPNEDVDESELFPADGRAYLELVKDMPSLDDREYEIRCWSKAFATRRRRDIEGRDIAKVLQEWKLTGGADGGPLSNASLNRRRTALMSMWSKLDGKSARNPVRDVDPFDESANLEPVRAHDPRILYRLLARIGRRKWKTRRPSNRGRAHTPSKTRARLRLILRTGWPHAQVKRLLPEHIDWKLQVVRVPARRKGKGKKKPRVVPVFPGALTALRRFQEADAWGEFSTSSMHSSLARAIKDENAWRHEHGKPPLPHIRPYDFRHTFGTELAKITSDERFIQEVMLLTNPSQVRRYTDAATSQRLEGERQAIVAKLGLSLPDASKRSAKRRS